MFEITEDQTQLIALSISVNEVEDANS